MRKGERTRNAILDQAVALASQIGLESLTVGVLAERTGMSKSGLFAHFGSKENLQLQVLKHAQDRFVRAVFAPALKEPRGLPRLRALFENWLSWLERDLPGGCPLLSATAEYDDRPGAVRNAIAAGQRELRGAIVKAIRLCIEAGDLSADCDPWQLGFELMGIALATHHDRRLLNDSRARDRARRAFTRLIEEYSPRAGSADAAPVSEALRVA